MYAGVRFSVLGPVRVYNQGVESGVGQPRQSAVLASLLLKAGRPVSTTKLVDDVWGDEAPPSAIGSVRTYIYRLRQTLGEQTDTPLRLVDGGYLLRIQADALDLNQFKATTARARDARAQGDLMSAATLFQEGLGMWNGVALAGVPGPFAEQQRRVLGELRLACAEDQLACAVERTRYSEAIADLSALLADHPLRERACGLLMTALYGAGRQAEALTIYHTTSHLLRQRLGVSPSHELQQVHEQILAGRLVLPQPDDRPRIVSGSPVLPTPAQLPAALPNLIGREDEWKRVENLIGDADLRSSVAICTIGGLPGVGKTAFATAVAHRLADRFPDGQLFVDLQGVGPESEPRDPACVLEGFLLSLGVRPEDIPETAQLRGLMFRGLLASRRVLVVLDNAGSSEQLRHLIPGSTGSMALVTSRIQLHELVGTYQALPLTLTPLSHEESRSFLSSRLGEQRASAEPDAVDRLICLTGQLPLALAHISARAAYRPGLRLSVLAEEYESSGRELLDAFAGDEDQAFDVRASFTRSYRLLDKETAGLFCDLSACPEPMFATAQVAHLAGRSECRVRQGLVRLTHAHLVSEIGPGRYSWNRLVAAYAAERASLRLVSEVETRVTETRSLQRQTSVT